MGAADIVPGVSGGTVALVLGIYVHLVATIRAGAAALSRIARGDLRGGASRLRQLDWAFLLPLLAGIALAVIVLSHTLESLLDTNPVEVAAVFFGLVCASTVIAARTVTRWNRPRLVVAAAVAVAAFFVLGLRSGPAVDPALWWIALGGALAVCAMILPGISGSFVLLMLGLYDYVLGAVNDRDLVVLAVLVAGCVGGLGAFSSVLDWLFRRHRDLVMAAMVGLLAGSLRVLWPWPEGTAGTSTALPRAGELWPAVGLAAAGALAVLAVAGLSLTRPADAAAAGTPRR